VKNHSREAPVPLRCRLDADVIIHRVSDFLLGPEIALGGLNRNVAEKKLDLFEFAARDMAEPGARPAQVVGCDFFDSNSLRKIPNDVLNDLLCQPGSPNDSDFVDGSE
jgi:hypothetical protein